MISEYYHVLQTQDHTAHSEVVSKDMSLEDYVRNGIWLAWNCQTRYIRGAPEGLPSFGHVGPVLLSAEDLEIAKENLREHFMVGLTERFDESLILLKRAFGWRTIDILYVKQKVAKNCPSQNAISAETIKIIEAHNELDIKLYEFAKQMFEQQISQQESSFRRELRIFRLCNRIYGLIMNKGLILLLALVKLLTALVKGEVQFSYVYNKVLDKVKAATKKRR